MVGNVITLLVVCGIMSAVGFGLGSRRGRPVLGAVLGFCLGLVGIGILFCFPKTKAARIAQARDAADVQAVARPEPCPQPEAAGLRQPGSGPDEQ